MGLFLHMTRLGELYRTEGPTNSEENGKHIAELNIFKKHIFLNTKSLTINFFYSVSSSMFLGNVYFLLGPVQSTFTVLIGY